MVSVLLSWANTDSVSQQYWFLNRKRVLISVVICWRRGPRILIPGWTGILHRWWGSIPHWTVYWPFHAFNKAWTALLTMFPLQQTSEPPPASHVAWFPLFLQGSTWILSILRSKVIHFHSLSSSSVPWSPFTARRQCFNVSLRLVTLLILMKPLVYLSVSLKQ